MLTARALYSNVSESPDELSFNQGDVLAVLQKDVNGLSGWWLCWIDGRLGLAPGNRLKVTARRVEPDDDDNTRPLEPELRSADDSKWTHVVKGLQQNDSNDSRPIYDVPPTVNSSSSLPQNTSNESYEIVYDVPPSSKTANHDKPRKVEFAGKTEGQDPCQTRNQSHVSHKTMSTTTTPGTAAAAHHQLRAFSSRETTTGRAETSPDSTGKSPSEDVGGDDGRRMGSVVRVCVEDDDDLSSEDTVASSTRTPRGLDVDLLRAEPGNRAPSSSSKYDNVSGATGSVAEEEEEEETGRLLSSAKRFTFYDPRSTGKAATLPRRIANGGTGRSEALGPITNRGYADHRSYHRSPTVQPSSSVSSGPSRTVGRLKVYDEGDSFTDNYYSVPTKWKTLPSPRYRQSSDSIGRQQQLFPTELGSVGRPSPPPKEDAVRTRRSRSEVRPTGDASDDPEYHLSFVDTGIFVDCPQDPRSVSETMESLQQTVRCRTDMIRDLCLGLDLSAAPAGAAAGGDARRNEADTVAQMKACCRSLRAALSEFADLGTGVLANAMQSPSRDMSENILQQLETLHALSEDLNDAVDSVIGASRGEPVGRRRANLRDAINSLLAITQDIVQPLDSLSYLVAKNSAVIFSAGRALPPPPPPVPGFPAIKGTRSPSSTSLIALPGTAGEFNFLPSNITTQALFSPRSIVEMHPGSPNILYIRNPSPGNPIHGRVAVDGKIGAQSPEFFRSFPNHRSSSPTPTVQALPLYFRSMTSSVPPCYCQPSNLPMVGPMIGGTGPEIPGPRGYLQARPPLPLPLEEEGAIVDHRSNDETVDWKSVENEYSSVASEAERDMKRNAGVLVGRLIERYGEAPSQFLRFDDPSSLAPPTNLGTLSPRRPTERTDERTGHVSEFLTRIDREIVQFYIEEVRSHCDAVKFAVDDFLGALVDDGSATGGSGLFVTLSRRVVLAAHKLLIAGDAVAKKFAFDAELRSRVGSIANDLDNGLRRTLVASQAGARRPTDGGNHSRRTEMIDCANQVKFLSVKLRDLISAYVFDRIE